MHACGARMALDDFGDACSSLRVVRGEARFREDRQVLHPRDQRPPENLQMLQAIKGIADVFGTTLIAEGIETQDDLRALRDLDIPYGQGWLLGGLRSHGA